MVVVVVEEPAKICARGQRIVVRYANGEKKEKSVREVEAVIALTRKFSITGDAINLLVSWGRPLLIASNYEFVGILHPFPCRATVITRREQLLSYYDSRGTHLAKMFVYASLENKVRVLKYFAHSRKRSDESLALELLEAAREISELERKLEEVDGPLDDVRGELLGIEGMGAAIYFDNIRKLFPPELGFFGRIKRPPTDPVNAVLSLGYVVVTSKVFMYVLLSGLDPYGGYLHADRSGKPSLALDLVEEFRQPIVDVVVVSCFSKRVLTKDDFIKENGYVRLSDSAKREFLARLKKRLETPTKLPEGTNTTFEKAIFHQARKIARFVLRRSNRYTPFVWRWWGDGA